MMSRLVSVLALFSLAIVVAAATAPLGTDSSIHSKAVPPPPEGSTAASHLFQPVTRQVLADDLLQKPLFVRGRAAMEAVSPPEANETQPRQQASRRLPALIGTLRRGEQFFAYFAGQGERSFLPGDRIAGWTIMTIDEAGASLGRGDVTRQVLLRPRAVEQEKRQGQSALGGLNDDDTN